MAQIQFLNGSRDAEIQDLVEEAGLKLGTASDAYIVVKDPAIESAHATIYSVRGQFYLRPESPNAKCFINFRPLPAEGGAVADKDLLMFGRTVAKFWRHQAPAVGGGPTLGGADPAELTRLQREKSELEQRLQQASQGASGAADSARRERDELAKQLEASKASSRKELEASQRAASETQKTAQEAQAALAAAQRTIEETKGSLEAAQQAANQAQEQAKQTEERLQAELTAERERVRTLEAEAEQAKPAREAMAKELEAVRAAVAALEAQDAVARRDRRPALRNGSDLAKALDALAVPTALRDRIAAAVRDEIDRELLARDGEVVPIRSLRGLAGDIDLEAELAKLKARRRQVEAIRALGASDLDPSDLEAVAARLKA